MLDEHLASQSPPYSISYHPPLCISILHHYTLHIETTRQVPEQLHTKMNDHERISSMRVSRRSYQAESSPFGLWSLPDPLDGPSFAPCYAPYGEQAPPIVSHPAVQQAPIAPTIETDARKAEGLKPWEKGSKTGKKIKTGRGPKARPRNDEQSSVGSKDVVSSNGSSNDNVNNDTPTTSTSTLPSSQPSPLSSAVSDPMLGGACRPRFRLLAPAPPVQIYPANTAQSAIAESRSTSMFSSFLTFD